MPSSNSAAACAVAVVSDGEYEKTFPSALLTSPVTSVVARVSTRARFAVAPGSRNWAPR